MLFFLQKNKKPSTARNEVIQMTMEFIAGVFTGTFFSLFSVVVGVTHATISVISHDPNIDKHIVAEQYTKIVYNKVYEDGIKKNKSLTKIHEDAAKAVRHVTFMCVYSAKNEEECKEKSNAYLKSMGL